MSRTFLATTMYSIVLLGTTFRLPAQTPAGNPPATVQASAPPAKAVARPRLMVSTASLQPESTVELSFPQNAVAGDKIKEPFPADLVLWEPAWPGTWNWKTQTLAQFSPNQPPAIGQTYDLKIAEKQIYEDGTEIPPGKIATLLSEEFALKSNWQQTGNELRMTRQPRTLLSFNDDVIPASMSPLFTYQNATGTEIPATVNFATEAERKDFSWRANRSWNERWDLSRTQSNDAPRKWENLVAVMPSQPLPLGKTWCLKIKSQIPNAAATRTAGARQLTTLGDVVLQEIQSVTPVMVPNQKPWLNVTFIKPLAEKANFAGVVQLVPNVGNLAIEATNGVLKVTGDFVYNQEYSVFTSGDVPSQDGLNVTNPKAFKATITALPSSIGLESYETAQLSHGTRKYEIGTCNIRDIRVRVKHMTGLDAVRGLQAYAAHYAPQNSQSNRPETDSTTKEKSIQNALPYNLIGGKTLFDRSWKWEDETIDFSHHITMEWDKVLQPNAPGILFLSTEGTAANASADKTFETTVAQSIVQLTDIGLAWKIMPQETLVYSFSLNTGAPLAQTKFTLYGPDASEIQSYVGNQDGICRIPKQEGKAILLSASRGADQFIVAWNGKLPELSLWRFPIEISRHPQKDYVRTAFMFTDRGLYRPGETVQLKGIVRRRLNSDLEMPQESQADFSVVDADSKEILRKKVTFTSNGTFSESFTLPPEKVGSFSAKLEFPKPFEAEKTAEEREDDDGEYEEYDEEGNRTDSHVFRQYFQVEEFKKNTFEVTIAKPAPAPAAEKLEFPLEAKYLMGQNLSDAAVTWYVQINAGGFYPAKYREFYFGDHQQYDPYYWAYYYGYKDRYTSSYREGSSLNGEQKLGADGKMNIEVLMPKGSFPSARMVSLQAEVTDVNQQTLNGSAEVTVHPADFYLGLARLDRLISIGEEISIASTAVGINGEAWGKAVEASVEVEQEAWKTVTIKTADGVMKTLNQNERAIVMSQQLTLQPGLENKNIFKFRPQGAGTHYVTIRSKDEAGRETASRMYLYVYGGEYAWEYEDGARIKLIPEKASYKPGETARILVLTPIDGHALVTLEQNKVRRSFVQKLSSQQPVIEIPITDEDSPNVYVSVMVIKGSRDSKREVKEPMVKLGYCNLMVENNKDALTVSLAREKKEYRPGATGTIAGTVTDFKNIPMANAEVTVWAVDEGVLSVMGYENPQPLPNLLPMLSLGVKCGASLDLLLQEGDHGVWYENKGFVIGDGSDGGALKDQLRKNFNPLAFWNAEVKTDEKGSFTANFTMPDSLTRYRLLAVAIHGVRKMGTGASSVLVNKPLMLEPVVPRFANVGDKLIPKALLHNTSSLSGTFSVTLAITNQARFSDAPGLELTKEIDLAAGETKGLEFNIEFTAAGESTWHWKASPKSISASSTGADLSELTDFVESKFPVQYPAPVLSEIHYVMLEAGKPQNLANAFSPAMQQHPSRIEMEVSFSRMVEATEALNFNLHYPYGCVEQTSNSTLPWFAALDLKGMLPGLKKTEPEIRKAIQAGADRLLAMQTDSGGLGYWIGNKEPTFWASTLGGSVLMLARQHGANVPDEAVKRLGDWLSASLRGTAERTEAAELQNAAAAVYTLALLGRPEPAYVEKLYQRRQQLSAAAQAYLALTLASSNGSKDQAIECLNTPATNNGSWSWNHYDYAGAMRLMAWSLVAPEHENTPKALDALLGTRAKRGDWANTYCNGWALNAMATYVQKVEKPSLGATVEFSGLIPDSVKLDSSKPAASFDKILDGTKPLELTGTIQGEGTMFAYVKVTAQPDITVLKSVDEGLAVHRTYEKALPDGRIEPLGETKIGDLVKVTLRLNIPGDVDYVVVDDALPSSFEAINEEFASQNTANVQANEPGWTRWNCDHKEMRDDRAVFFVNRCYRGDYVVNYMARVSSVGEVIAPQAKIEAMYDPARYGLSGWQNVVTHPRTVAPKTTAK